MNRKSNPLAIGIFVLGAIVLTVAGLAVFGGNRLFSQTDRFQMYFDESLKGLAVGAPVAFSGVNIGNVTAIAATFDPTTDETSMPVTVELRKESLQITGGGDPTPETIERLVANGLRGQLGIESLVTGQLYVGLDFFPRAAPAQLTNLDDIPIIPTVPSPFAGVSRALDDVTMAIPDLLVDSRVILDQLKTLLGGDEAADISESIRNATELLALLAAKDGGLQTTLDKLPPLIAQLETTLGEVTTLSQNLGGTVDAVTPKVEATLARVDALTVAFERAADQVNNLIAENRADIRVFTGRGLGEAVGLLADGARLVTEMRTVLRDFRQDPARFFLTNRTAEGIQLE